MDLMDLLLTKAPGTKAIFELQVSEMLHAMQIVTPTAPDASTTAGDVRLGQKRTLAGFADLSIDPALLPAAIHFPFTYVETVNSFQLDVNISAAAQAVVLDAI